MGAVESVAPTPTGKLKAHPYNCSAPLGDWGGRNGARESPRPLQVRVDVMAPRCQPLLRERP
jgi:hypothetical protein